jgi:hypothetical protein
MQFLKSSQSNRWRATVVPLVAGILVNFSTLPRVYAECEEWYDWATLGISCAIKSTSVANVRTVENPNETQNPDEKARIEENSNDTKNAEENAPVENAKEIPNVDDEKRTTKVAKVRCTKWYDWATLGVSCLIKSAIGPSLPETENAQEIENAQETEKVPETENAQKTQNIAQTEKGECGEWYDWATLGISCAINSTNNTDEVENTRQLDKTNPTENDKIYQKVTPTVEPDYDRIVKDTSQEVINAIESIDWVKIGREAGESVRQAIQAENEQQLQKQLTESQRLFKEQQGKHEQRLKAQQKKHQHFVEHLDAEKQELVSENQQLVLINQQLILENQLLHNTFNQKITSLEKKLEVLLQGNPWQKFSENIKEVIQAGDMYEYAMFRNGGFRKLTWSTWKSGYRVITEPYMTGDDWRHYRLGGSLWIWDNQLDSNDDQGVYHYYYFYDNGTVKSTEGNKLTEAEQGGEGYIYRRKR